MRLVELIRNNHAAIIESWQTFARTLDPSGELTDRTLRDHAREILEAIATEMERPQSESEQDLKSKGKGGPNPMDAVSTVHAKLRIGSGFRIEQIVAEYRALRASVLQLCAHEGLSGPDTLGEVTRFNEAVDSSIAEVLFRYSGLLAQFRDQSLAILGHDLRTPLTAIILFAQMLSTSKAVDDKCSRMAARILADADRINRILGEFMDLSRTRFGVGLNCSLGPVNLNPLCQQVLADLEEYYPGRVTRFEAIGDLEGEWDGDRIAQLTSYLVRDAIQHGGDGPVSVTVRDDGQNVNLEIHQQRLIPSEVLGRVFEPFVRAAEDDTHTGSAAVGLGLYLVEQIAIAHGGAVGVNSTIGAGTTFWVRLPRHPPPT